VRCSSLLDVYMKGEDDYHDMYRLPLQPIHTDIHCDRGILVVNLCSSSVGYLHQLSSVGPLSHIVAAMDVICRGAGPRPSISVLLNDACRLYDDTTSLPVAALEQGPLAHDIVAAPDAPPPQVADADSLPIADGVGDAFESSGSFGLEEGEIDPPRTPSRGLPLRGSSLTVPIPFPVATFPDTHPPARLPRSADLATVQGRERLNGHRHDPAQQIAPSDSGLLGHGRCALRHHPTAPRSSTVAQSR
jgi:hypothetical protein